ncbi:cholecystokinin [Chanos chanos]|uniref:Cholecystokinin n=1 Tax=Chanos chanos TaxID=29144 RepID=A0A6J2W4C7_CHACN|nr:cholecystokinin [Chanos chanos]
MNGGICVCVLLAALSSSACLGLPTHSQDEGQSDNGALAEHTRHTRGVPPSSQLSPFSRAEERTTELQDNLNELLARLLSRKGSYRRTSSLSSRSSGPGPSHRIKDRDYLGWMDFGRRSAEEYEYSS